MEKIFSELAYRIQEARKEMNESNINDAMFDYHQGRVEALETFEAFLVSEFA